MTVFSLYVTVLSSGVLVPPKSLVKYCAGSEGGTFHFLSLQSAR